MGFENVADTFIQIVVAIFGGVCGGFLYDMFGKDDK